MSASPTAAPTQQSTKRPLEDPSSPSAPNDQPEAKRPALDKIVKDEDEEQKPTLENVEPPIVSSNGNTKAETNGAKPEFKDEQGDTVVPDAASHSIESTATSSRDPPATGSTLQHDESGWIHIRAVITSAEAATVIGKGGENVSMIRKMSGAKCTVSDYQKGAVERILTVSGVVDAAAKVYLDYDLLFHCLTLNQAFGLIIRTLNNEPLEAPSSAQSKTYPLRLLIPHILIGSIIGKGGVRIREIQEASGARLNASDSCLPLSTERSLVVLGVADAVHIATYYVGSTLFEQLSERFGGPAASAYASRSGGPAGVVPGGMQVVPYVPQPAGGSYGHPDNRRHLDRGHHTPAHAYGQPYAAHGQTPQQQPAVPMHYGGSPQVGGYGGVGPQQPQQPHVGGPQSHAGPPAQPMQGMVPGQPLTQQIFIPNDMVGAIIGKGGAKINEIRQLSGSVIKINEPQDNSNERLVTITGTQECNQMALYMLYSRLGKTLFPICQLNRANQFTESEKHRI
jgi:heterogeneous nuclear rnp K-like protein 2